MGPPLHGPCGERAEKVCAPRLLRCLWPRAATAQDLIPSARRSADPEGAARGERVKQVLPQSRVPLSCEFQWIPISA